MNVVNLQKMSLLEVAEHVERLAKALAIAVDRKDSSEMQSDLDVARQELSEREVAKREYREKTGLMSLRGEELKQRFVKFAIEKDDAEDVDQQDRFYWLLDDIVSELKARGDEQWRLLLPLYEHRDIRVRYHAADFTKSFLPTLSQERLWALDDDDWHLPDDIDGAQRQVPRLPSKLKALSADGLVERFIDMETKQADALLGGAIDEFNRGFGLVDAVNQELKSRPGDGRFLLLPYLQHANIGVRLGVARAILAIAPEAARRVLEYIANSGEMPFAGDAGMTIWNLDRGFYKPI